MKDNSLDGHRGKVALSDTTKNLTQQQQQQARSATTGGNNSSGGNSKCDLKATSTGVSGSSNNNDGTTATNFDDDYNEWELGIGDLIIDLDADIEKTNERNNANNCGTTTTSTPGASNTSGSPNNHTSHLQNGSIGASTSSSVPSLVSSTTSTSSSTTSNSTATAFTFLGAASQTTCSSGPTSTGQPIMSNSKSSRGSIGATGTGSNSGSTSSCSTSSACIVVSSGTSGNSNSSSNSSVSVGAAVEHQATVDKGLKMKIKRKTVGNKYSEAKHEIVQSDTKTSVTSLNDSSAGNSSNVNCIAGTVPNSTLGVGNVCISNNETPKSKHSSGKGRNSGHREKKEKNRDKDKNSGCRSTNPTVEMNGVLGVMSPSLKITSGGVSLSTPAPQTSAVGTSVPSPLTQNGTITGPASLAPRAVVPGVPVGTSSNNSVCSNPVLQTVPTSIEPLPGQQTLLASNAQAISSSNSPPMPNLTLKIENKYSPTTPCSVLVKQEEMPDSPPLKRIKIEPVDKVSEVDGAESPIPPEMKDTSTCTSVGTITEPDCLGPCEPGTSVMLEGIVWQETEGGVLVVNVTWRGKTYVGTLLDCTKHDWAPPRFCESPTSDVDNKATKGRGKRGRGSNNNATEVNTFDPRTCVQSKLRNGKGRRTTINSSNFTVPSSPAKSDSGSAPNTKRKGRPVDLEITATVTPEGKSSKRSRLQSRGTPTSGSSSEFPQPSSPVLIECPEPNCNKKYKHINGLRYHQQHAHSGSDGGNNKMEDTNTEDSKDVTNSSDNEESAQENISVPASPAMSFTNAVASPHAGSGRNAQIDSTTSSNITSLPESDPYNLTPDLSTLASVAISDSKSAQSNITGNSTWVTPTMPSTLQSAGVSSQELPVIVSVEGTKNMPSVLQCASSCSSSVPASAPSSVISVVVPPTDITNSTIPAVAASSSVIHSSASDTPTVVTPAVTVSIPTSHVVFSNQGMPSGVCSVAASTTQTTTVAISCHNSSSHPPTRTSLSTVSAATYVPVTPAVANVSSTSPSAVAVDKSKMKQQQQQPERLDKYKPKSPMAASAIRPIVPAPAPQLIALSTNMSTHPGINQGSHSLITTSLKPIQPKPTILGEPTTINPALESLKKEKSKHKKKNRDKDRERKLGVPVPLSSIGKMGTHPNEECEPLDIHPYPSLDAAAGARDPLNSAMPLSTGSHNATPLIPMDGQKLPDPSLDLSLADDNINENIQSPAYSDISDANDTAPVLESEVPSGKEKEDKVGKSTPDAAQSPAANISAYGIYPYYSQPPYLLPSVSPQSSAPQSSSAIEKVEPNKKTDQERIKENRPWSNPSGESGRDRPAAESEPVEKKQSRENGTPNSNVVSSPAVTNPPLQEYQIQQPYAYPYGYIQGYPYAVPPESGYHMHLLDSDPHYKQTYKQYMEDQQQQQQRAYKEQQHHQAQQQQQQQQHHQQHSHHHQQQQHHHHSQHQAQHPNKIHHSSIVKEERDRSSSREHKERSSEKLGTIHNEQHQQQQQQQQQQQHVNKIQHSSMSLVQTGKEHDQRDHQQPQDTRPPSLPTQSRNENASFSSAVALKEKQNENHQILKENIELKSQMEDSKNNVNRFEMAMLYERHREDVRRYYMYERYVEQQQKMEPGFHHHTHHHQTIHPHQLQPHSSASSLKPHKDDMSSSLMGHSKQSHYAESSRTSAVMSPAKSEHIKSSSSHPHSSSSPKGASMRDSMSSHSGSKDYSSSNVRDSSSSKKDSYKNSDRPEGTSSSREEKTKIDKIKVEKPEPEGQKPTMETTGPPPPPTNAYAYLHPSYLQPPHFPHMPFEPAAHAVYRGGLNPMIMSTPSYGASPYVHPQLRYVPPGACEIPAHSQTPTADPLVSKGLHSQPPPKALDLLHQVSQHYTTHKIHELQEHALMSPTPPTSTPAAAVASSTPSTSTSGNNNSVSTSSNSSSSTSSKVSASESTGSNAKVVDASGSRDSSRSPPTQRHLHTHHHTHVGVGYPLYDPYGAIIASPAPAVDVKPIHPLHPVKTAPAAGRYWQ